MSELVIETPRIFLPLLKPNRFIGAKGGRASGKSHFLAEKMVENHIADPYEMSVCLREVQKSLKFSAKRLIESKIRKFRAESLFKITDNEIRTKRGDGIIIFQGLQDHTAESVKSLEGFRVAWMEEAQSITQYSLDILVPTIRLKGSEVWASWNPEKEDRPIEQLFRSRPTRSTLVHANYLDNPFCPQESIDEANEMKAQDPEKYRHIWLGGYKKISEAQIFKKWRKDRFVADPVLWDGPYQGIDFGFSSDLFTFVRCWVHGKKLYIEYEVAEEHLELDDYESTIKTQIPEADKFVARADNSRPDSISYMKRHGFPLVGPCEKGKGSVESGVEFIQNFEEIIIHPRCENMLFEMENYQYKTDRYTGEVLPIIIDKFNHSIDALRYALEPLSKSNGTDWDNYLKNMRN